MSKLLLFSLIVCGLLSTRANAQVLLRTAPTISYTYGNNFSDNIANDGDGNSVAISDLDLQIFAADENFELVTDNNLETHGSSSDAGWPDYQEMVIYGVDGANYAWVIKSDDASNFSFIGVDFNDWGGSGEDYVIQAYDDGQLIDSFTFPANTSNGTMAALSQLSTNEDWKLPSYFMNVDEVRIIKSDEQPQYTGLNNVTVGYVNSLPVKLVSFAANSSENTVHLNWETAEETDFSHFEVQRSTDGRAFSTIASVKSAGGQSASYEYKDPFTLTPVVYYRLKMIDADGSYAMSRMVAVKQIVSEEFRVYPNPAVSSLQVSAPELKAGSAILRVVNGQGQVLINEMVSEDEKSRPISVNIADLNAGKYFIQTVQDGVVNTSSFVKQ